MVFSPFSFPYNTENYMYQDLIKEDIRAYYFGFNFVQRKNYTSYLGFYISAEYPYRTSGGGKNADGALMSTKQFFKDAYQIRCDDYDCKSEDVHKDLTPYLLSLLTEKYGTHSDTIQFISGSYKGKVEHRWYWRLKNMNVELSTTYNKYDPIMTGLGAITAIHRIGYDIDSESLDRQPVLKNPSNKF